MFGVVRYFLRLIHGDIGVYLSLDFPFLIFCSQVAKTFFIANRGTCRSWVNRVRRIAAGIALRCGNVPAAVFTGMKWLQEISSKGDVQVSL